MKASIFQLVCRENKIKTFDGLDNDQCTKAIFDSVKAHEDVVKSSFVALAKEGLL